MTVVVCPACGEEHSPPFAEVGDQWELVSQDGPYDRTERMPAPGGWLYRTMMIDDNDRADLALVFVPDAHEARRA